MRYRVLEDGIVVSKLFAKKEILYANMSKIRLDEAGTEITLRDGSKELIKGLYLRAMLNPYMAKAIVKNAIHFIDDYSNEMKVVYKADLGPYVEDFIEKSRRILNPLIKAEHGEEYELHVEIKDTIYEIFGVYRIKCNGEILEDMPGYADEYDSAGEPLKGIDEYNICYLKEYNPVTGDIAYFLDNCVEDEAQMREDLEDYTWKAYREGREKRI